MKLHVAAGLAVLGLTSSARADLLSSPEWQKSFESPYSAQGDGRAQDYKKFSAGGKKSNDKDLAAWLQQKVTASVGKPVTFEIKDCDKTAKHAPYQQEQLHGRLMQSIVADIDALSRFPEGKAALQSKLKGVKMQCVSNDTCPGDTRAEQIKCDGPTFVYDNGYYYIHWQVGDDGDALPFVSGAKREDDFRYDESTGPSVQTQLMIGLVKKHLPEYQKAASDAFDAPLTFDVDWAAFSRTSKQLPGYPLQGGWAVDYIQEGLETVLSRFPDYIKEYYRQAEQYDAAEIPLVKKNLKKVKLTMQAPNDDTPPTPQFKGDTLTIKGRWQPALGISDTDVVPAILSASGKAH